MHRDSVHQSVLCWEESKGVFEFLKALLPTCRNILFKPVDFFQQLFSVRDVNLKKRIIHACLFAIVLGYIKLFLDVVNLKWLGFISKNIPSESLQLQVSYLSTAILNSPFFSLRPIIAFLLVLIFVSIGIKLILGFDKPLMPVFLVVCYESAANIFYCIPMIGGVFAGFWSLVITVIGVREGYKVNLARSIISSIVIPLLFLLFFLLSLGNSLSRVFITLYPESQLQLIKLNDGTAYLHTAAIVSATQKYKQELGFYPANLDVLSKYLSSEVINDIKNIRHPSGYIWRYRRIDDEHFILEVWPVKVNYTGRFVFYANETGKVRLDGPEGRWIRDLKELEGCT